MKKFALPLSTALLLSVLACPAAAFVLDREDLVPAAEEKKLTSELGRLGKHHFEVKFVSKTSNPLASEAENTFNSLRLGEEDGVIVVAVQAKKIGAYVGAGFTERGVSDQVVTQRIQTDFLPYAKKGQFALGAAALAKGLVDAGGQEAHTAPTSAPSPTTPLPAPSSTGLANLSPAYLWLLALLLIPLGFWALERQRRALQKRLEALRQPHETIVTGCLKLAELDESVRFQGDVQQAYLTLGQEAKRAIENARIFCDDFDEMDKLLKAYQSVGLSEPLKELECKAITMSAHVAASLTALDEFEAGGLNGQQALQATALLERVQEQSPRLVDVQTAFEREAKRARQNDIEPSPRLKSALEESIDRLTQFPVDPEGVEWRLDDAERALSILQEEVEWEIQRRREVRRARWILAGKITLVILAIVFAIIVIPLLILAALLGASPRGTNSSRPYSSGGGSSSSGSGSSGSGSWGSSGSSGSGSWGGSSGSGSGRW